MKLSVNHTPLKKLKTDLLVIPAAPAAGDSKKSTAAKKPWARFDAGVLAEIRELNGTVAANLGDQIEQLGYKPASGKRLDYFVGPRARIGVVRISGLNSFRMTEKGSLDEWRKLGGDAYQSAKRLRSKSMAISLGNAPAGLSDQIVEAVVEGLLLAEYEFTEFKGTKAGAKERKKELVVELLCGKRSAKEVEAAAKRASVWADAVRFARDLVNTPPSDMTPDELLSRARKVIAGKRGRVRLKAFGRSALRRMKAFSLLGVARGSDAEPYLLHLEYRPQKRTKGQKVITLVGKGITFDSGGLSIKTGKGMEDMKCDMAGAACVLSVLRALLNLPAADQPKHEIHILIPTAENMINGDSLKPGDVISAMNGKTIEVLNTDAEGRLILADALSYSKKLKSDLIIDLATLTGACIVALGSDYAGMFSNDRAIEQKLLRAGELSGEHLWPLPLATEYRSQMESDVADIKNIGNGGPGAILGALFLKEFVPEKTPWVHLDIAGPAFSGRSNEYIKRGGTGFGVLTLGRLLRDL